MSSSSESSDSATNSTSSSTTSTPESSLSSSDTLESSSLSESDSDNPEPVHLQFLREEPNPQEVETALNSLVDGDVQPDNNLRRAVMHLLSRKKLDALIEANYDLAERYDKAIDSLFSSAGKTLYDQEERTSRVSIDDRIAAAQEKLRSTKEKYEQKQENLKNDRFEAAKRLNTRHNQQNEEFRKKWRSPAFLARFQRPSPELLEMRYIERRMALSKNYEEAKEARKIANVQQRKEERVIQANLEDQMKRDFFRMKDQHSADIERLNKRFDYLEEQLELQRVKEIEPIEFYLAELEKKKSAPVRKVNLLPRSLMTLGEVDENEEVLMKTSPRTAARYAEFRNDKRGELKVRGVSDRMLKSLLAAYPVDIPHSRTKAKTRHASRASSVCDDL